MLINPQGLLYVENGGLVPPDPDYEPCQETNDKGYCLLDNSDYETTVAMTFQFPTDHLYGLPGREYSFNLPTTEESGPYRLFNKGPPTLYPDEILGLTGSIPYVTGRTTEWDSAVAWVNAADTWVDILKDKSGDYTNVNFASEGGLLHFFVYASVQEDSPARITNNLAQITGYLVMPPIAALGFHFSKWAPISSEMVIERSQNFTHYNFPVDGLWTDIQYALWSEDENTGSDDYRWFTWNPYNFTDNGIEDMKDELIESKRHFTTILDPYIKEQDDYFVFTDGMLLQDAKWAVGDASNIFMRDDQGDTFFGQNRAGNSTFMDFLNENAQDYWSDLYTKFEHTDHLFYVWNDVQDPPVYNGPMGAMPVQNQHIKKDGTVVLHRDIHNAYGPLETKATYEGMRRRDGDGHRHFILSRSFFLGSQKYGATWLGDNLCVYGEVSGALQAILSQGVSGHPFTGADLPGFKYEPEDNFWIMMYQFGTFFPFMRAHSHESW